MKRTQDLSKAMIEAGELAFTEAALENASKGEICSAVYLAMQSARISTLSEDVDLTDQLERLGNAAADGRTVFGPKVSVSVAVAAAYMEAAELVRRHIASSSFAALVEGLHAQIYGVHALADPQLSHDALSDSGVIHEAAHALLRALPAPAALKDNQPTKETDREALLGEALENLKFGMDFSYEQGLHEFGYDPLETVTAEVTRLREQIAAKDKLLSEALIYVDECFGDLDRSLASRIRAALTDKPAEAKP